MVLKGVAASPGKAAGNILVIQDIPEYDREEKSTAAAQESIRRVDEAIDELNCEMESLSKRLSAAGDDMKAAMVQMHAAMLTDKILRTEIEKEINRGYSPPAAVARAAYRQQKLLLSLNDTLMKERAQDVKDVSKRLICRLTGQTYPDLSDLRREAIIVSDNLLPSMLTSANGKVKGLIMAKGSKTSHVAILAANMGIPAVLGCASIENLHDGEFVFLDAVSGTVYSGLSDEKIRWARGEDVQYRSKLDRLSVWKNRKSVTKDGKRIHVLANIMDASVTDQLMENGADGVGLFRTEFLYMNRETMPNEDEQFVIYQNVAKKLKGRPLTIRTMDIGADKTASCLKMEKEENPSLGYRAIRICLDRPEILKVQLAAALRASVFGKIKIMFPMISGTEELDRALEILKDVKAELEKKEIPFDKNVPVGIMIEVPSAAVLADKLVGKADFFSIGSNDLTQYTLAADRLNGRVSHLYSHLNPAVLRLIRNTIDTANKNGKTCSVCGEMAADPAALPILIGMGLKNISVNPPSVLLMKNLIGLSDQSRLAVLAEQAVEAETPQQVLALVKDTVSQEYKNWY
ncbi:phosphoenolpyruvate--protein phosphotransferase [Clostridium sp. KNHs216]|uniref:phosphoenolpyruvate--protein phosphotransferase n=1 Tax=Clostridium sp. KNHs216 TaxID=1550235 RepID=UPI00115106FD|nr:phosphoenolpyruvate--protein phosphotransferase [Clostridium sp. KNHs216]TQI68254.1 phosphotransferase system enzyme I (PtsI) [Clostridium sp. KNHs216]